MDDLPAIYSKVKERAKDALIKYLEYGENTQFYPNPLKFSDLSVIALVITAECLQIDSENLLFSKIEKDYSDFFPDLCYRTKFNLRRKKLREYLICCSHSMAEAKEYGSHLRIVL